MFRHIVRAEERTGIVEWTPLLPNCHTAAQSNDRSNVIVVAQHTGNYYGIGEVLSQQTTASDERGLFSIKQ
jgi:hypothetical protein